MKIPNIEVSSEKKISTILRDLEAGRIRVPRFQRNFVWDLPKILKFLDSIYKEFPIGSFFFWEAPGKYNLFYRDLPELGIVPPKPRPSEIIGFILDGQQRICSLYAAVNGIRVEIEHPKGKKIIDCSQICLDLDYYMKKPDENNFVRVFEKHKEDDCHIPLYRILSPDNLEIFSKLDKKRQEIFRECNSVFQNYPLSIVTVKQKDLDSASTIFERINQGGQRLSLFDLISAGTWSQGFDLREKVKEKNKQFENWGAIDPEVYTQTLALIAKKSCTKSSQLQLTNDDIQKHWDKLMLSLDLAVTFLKNNLGVIYYSFLPYRGLLAMLIYFYYNLNSKSPTSKQADLIKRWFWQITFSEHYGSSTLTKMTEDKRLIGSTIREKEFGDKYKVKITTEDILDIMMYRKSAIKNGVLCLLALKNPRHFKNNSELPLGQDDYYSEFDIIEKHHVFPKSYIKSRYSLSEIHVLPNFCFIPKELNKSILNKKPSDYFKNFSEINEDFNKTLKSHLLEYDDAIKTNNYKVFLYSRAVRIKEEITKLIGSFVFSEVGESENAVLDKYELKIRDLIHDILSRKNPNYWHNNLPIDIKKETEKRILQYMKKVPGKSYEDLKEREKLDYLNVMDYLKIIMSNWDVFGPVFRSKTETQRRFLGLNEYRNSLKHNKKIASFLVKDGEAALEWLSSILKAQSQKTKQARFSNVETTEQIEKRLANVFLKKMVRAFPAWVKQNFSEDDVYVFKGNTGSNYYLKIKGRAVGWYYFAQSWVFFELSLVSKEEKQLLGKQLAKPESILERGYGDKARFHLVADKDFEILKKIIKDRVIK